MRKIVLMPITVPTSNFCWDGKTVCGYFDNSGGHPVCELGFYPLKYSDEIGGVLKPTVCATLKVATNIS